MSFLDRFLRPRREVRKALAENKTAEAMLWARVAREESSGPKKDEAARKSEERAREARHLQEEFLRIATGVFGRHHD